MKRRMYWCVGVALLAVAAYAGDDDKKANEELKDPREILKRMDEKCKGLKAVKYEIASEPSAELKELAMRTQGTVMAARAPDASSPDRAVKFVFEARVTPPKGNEAKKFTVAADADKYYFIDHQDKKYYVDLDAEVLGRTGTALARATILEYVHPTPFTDEIKGKTCELRGSKTIAGVDCYEIHVVYAAEQAPEATWFVGKKDFLPHGRIDHLNLGDGKKGTIERTVSKLETDPKLPDDAFKLKLPEGYTKSNDFAP